MKDKTTEQLLELKESYANQIKEAKANGNKEFAQYLSEDYWKIVNELLDRERITVPRRPQR